MFFNVLKHYQRILFLASIFLCCIFNWNQNGVFWICLRCWTYYAQIWGCTIISVQSIQSKINKNMHYYSNRGRSKHFSLLLSHACMYACLLFSKTYCLYCVEDFKGCIVAICTVVFYKNGLMFEKSYGTFVCKYPCYLYVLMGFLRPIQFPHKGIYVNKNWLNK